MASAKTIASFAIAPRYSGLMVPVLSFGTGTFGGTGDFFGAWGQSDVAEARRLVEICLEAGAALFLVGRNGAAVRRLEGLEGVEDEGLVARTKLSAEKIRLPEVRLRAYLDIAEETVKARGENGQDSQN